MTDKIKSTVLFIKEKFMEADGKDGFNGKYRYEHSLRTAGIGQKIAQAEGLDEEALIIACLLHDIGYVLCKTEEDHDRHGQLSALIAGEYLDRIGYEPNRIKTICYGIKIHTEPVEEYEHIPTAFEASIADADNIDRFDAYRLYVNLSYFFKEDGLTPERMLENAKLRIERSERYANMEFGTKTATLLWKDIIGFQQSYFIRLKDQLENMQNFCKELTGEVSGYFNS